MLIDQSRYTDRTRRVVTLAAEVADQFGNIQPEHILYAIAKEGNGVGAKALERHDITPDSIADALACRPEILAGTGCCRKVDWETLGRTAAEADGCNYVGTEHILSDLAANIRVDLILQHHGTTVTLLRETINDLGGN